MRKQLHQQQQHKSSVLGLQDWSPQLPQEPCSCQIHFDMCKLNACRFWVFTMCYKEWDHKTVSSL
jgi:hypothetical protein